MNKSILNRLTEFTNDISNVFLLTVVVHLLVFLFLHLSYLLSLSVVLGFIILGAYLHGRQFHNYYSRKELINEHVAYIYNLFLLWAFLIFLVAINIPLVKYAKVEIANLLHLGSESFLIIKMGILGFEFLILWLMLEHIMSIYSKFAMKIHTRNYLMEILYPHDTNEKNTEDYDEKKIEELQKRIEFFKKRYSLEQ